MYPSISSASESKSNRNNDLASFLQGHEFNLLASLLFRPRAINDLLLPTLLDLHFNLLFIPFLELCTVKKCNSEHTTIIVVFLHRIND